MPVDKRVYFDNAATTPLDKEVLDVMIPFMLEYFGNPSSIHSHGREVKAAIEKARRTIAGLLNTSPSEVFFTSGGTEADNTFIHSCITTYDIKHAITSPLEHHAVLHTLEALEKQGLITLTFVEVDEKGNINLDHLKQLLENHPRSLVSLMHANNEIGTMNDIEAIGEICDSYKAIYHADTVQTIGHYKHNLQQLKVASIVGSAHKFHGPKGVGFIYINNNNKISPMIHGGAQERNMRGGTENVYGIIGLAKALEIAYRDMESHRKHIEHLKSRMITRLKEEMPFITFNGESANLERSLYTVLNIGLPPSEINDMLLFSLDINKISVSGGSACSSGTNIGSHVLKALNFPDENAAIRFSFSRYNSEEEVDYVVSKLKEIYKQEPV
jgi:cysteine desulfurase